MNAMRTICVFCGASIGACTNYAKAAKRTVEIAAGQGARFVYGGGRSGLMGVVAEAALTAGAEVVGIIPQHLADRELVHPNLTELRVVASLHERKRTMADQSDAFIALPGGFGTLEEVAEVLSWAQIGLHTKPIGLLNVNGYFTPLLQLFDSMVAHGFLPEAGRRLAISHADPERLLQAIAEAPATIVDRWGGTE